MSPFAACLQAALDGDEEALLRIERDDGRTDTQPVADYLRDAPTELETKVLDLATGRIVDVGCGAGRHVLRMQREGHDITGCDIDPALVALCRARGCEKVAEADILAGDLGEDAWDTALLFGNNLGLGGNPEGTRRLLGALRHALAPGGRVLFTSVDVTQTDNPTHLAYHQRRRAEGRSPGELTIRLSFAGCATAWFGWHHVSPEELGPLAAETGWRIERICRGNSGPYAGALS